MQLLAVQLTLAGEFEQANAFADRAIEADGSGQSYGAKAFVLLQNGGSRDEVDAYYQRAIELDPFNSIETYVTYTRYLLDQSQPELAKDVLDFILPFYEDEDLPQIIQFGDLQIQLGLLEFQRARWASTVGDVETERAALERTLELHPTYGLAQLSLIHI